MATLSSLSSVRSSSVRSPLGHEFVVSAHGGFQRQPLDGGDEVERCGRLLEAEHLLAGQGAHAGDLRAFPPPLEQHRRVARGLLLKLVQELEQEAGSGVVGHLELREEGPGHLGLRWPGNGPRASRLW
jgi:hypothetical protein